MLKTILKNATARIIVGLTAIGLWLIGPALIENGRLSEFACYLILGLGAVFAMWLIWLDSQIRTGRINQNTLPKWLRN